MVKMTERHYSQGMAIDDPETVGIRLVKDVGHVLGVVIIVYGLIVWWIWIT